MNESDLCVADVSKNPHETGNTEPISETCCEGGSHERSFLLETKLESIFETKLSDNQKH